MGGDIARIMSGDVYGQQILSIYWAVAPAAVRGVLDQIRTALTLLVAELRATMPPDEQVPSAATANQAVQVVVTGKRHNVRVNAAHGEGAASSANVTVREQKGAASPFWTRSRMIGAFVVGDGHDRRCGRGRHCHRAALTAAGAFGNRTLAFRASNDSSASIRGPAERRLTVIGRARRSLP